MTEPLRTVRVRFLPWKPRWRSKDGDWDVPDGVLDGADDPISLVIGLVLVVLLSPFVVLFVVGVLLLSFELILLLALLPFAMLGQILGLRAWQLALTPVAGEKTYVAVKGTLEMLAARCYYRSLRV